MHPMLGELNSLLDRARGTIINGERAPLFIRSDMTFLEGQDQAVPMVFNVPTGEDFYATRLNLYLQSRMLNIASPDTQSERTFRATDWTSVNEFVNGISFPAGANDSGDYQNKYANCVFEVKTSDGRKFQNSPMSILHAFSDREPLPEGSAILFISATGYSITSLLPPYAAYVGGMDFDVEERIPSGSAWNLIVTPTFSRDVSPQSVDRREFKVVGVLTGHKKVKPSSYKR